MKSKVLGHFKSSVGICIAFYPYFYACSDLVLVLDKPFVCDNEGTEVNKRFFKVLNGFLFFWGHFGCVFLALAVPTN